MKRILRFFLCTVATIITIVLVAIIIRVLVIERASPADLAYPETKFLITDAETKLAYHVFVGDSTDVVFLVGGLGAWRDSWQSTITEERVRGNNATFVVIDLPPFGLSQAVKQGDYSRVTQAARVAAVIEAVASTSNRVTLIGHSYGGGPVAEVMFRESELIDQVVLISPVINLGTESTRATPPVLAIRPIRTGLAAVVLTLPPLQRLQLESFLAITTQATYETLKLFTRPFRQPGSSGRLGDWIVGYVTDNLPEAYSTDPIKWADNPVPVTLIWGESDTLTPITDAYSLQAVNPAITLIPLKGVGHIPMLEDQLLFHEALQTVWSQEKQ